MDKMLSQTMVQNVTPTVIPKSSTRPTRTPKAAAPKKVVQSTPKRVPRLLPAKRKQLPTVHEDENIDSE